MIENIITLNVKDLPYKKMQGLLKFHKINPDYVALRVEFSEEFTRFTPLERWQNYLPYSHKVVSILLYKINNIFLFVGHSIDSNSIVYNPEFSKFLLEINLKQVIKSLDNSDQEIGISTPITYSKSGRLNMILDKINRLKGGINSLSIEEKKELDELSRNNN
jgi:hypothetical protein